MENNRKYFLKETGEELEFGDVLELNCVKELEDGRATIEKEIVFSQEAVEALVNLGIVEEKEPLINFSEDEEEDTDCPYDEIIQAMIEDQEALEKRVDTLEEEFKKFIDKSLKQTEKLIKIVTEASNKENASSKKK